MGHIKIVSIAIVQIRRRANADDIAIGSVSIVRYAVAHDVISTQRRIEIYAGMVCFSYAVNLNCIFQQNQNFRHFGHFRLGAGIGLLARFIDNNLNYIILNLA